MKYEKTKLFFYRLSNGFSLLRFNFTVNICSTCNRKCKFCPNWAPDLVETYYTRWIKKQPDLMDVDKFENMLKRMGILRYFMKYISITGRGDPTSHPDLLKFCQIANHYKKDFMITTNGDKLTPDFFNELSKLKYFKYIRVSLFNIERAKYWLDIQKKNNVRIEFQNETGIKLKGYDDGYISYNNPGTAKYITLPLHFVKETYCRHPFSFVTLNTDGTIVPCITFFEVGNAFDEPFLKVWNGQRMRLIRKVALKMAIPDEHMAYCRDCGVMMKEERYAKLNSYLDHNINEEKLEDLIEKS